MNTIPVSLGKNSYEIHTQLGLSNTLSILLDPLNNHQKWVLFTQEDILQIYGNKILSQLKSANFDIYQIILKNFCYLPAWVFQSALLRWISRSKIKSLKPVN